MTGSEPFVSREMMRALKKLSLPGITFKKVSPITIGRYTYDDYYFMYIRHGLDAVNKRSSKIENMRAIKTVHKLVLREKFLHALPEQERHLFHVKGISHIIVVDESIVDILKQINDPGVKAIPVADWYSDMRVTTQKKRTVIRRSEAEDEPKFNF